ncbi:MULTISPECIES: hypothetical protein [unclassified Sphingomonas]|uniref:hypothetical protein n=1 Tax=unclassified Sphingomonas TaxID=196159 RepID=UPI00092B1FF1|nr:MULTISPECIES: hypothetical protein [unclassified Sphingomonas]MBN8849655.1 hypothetical protein [Sphingomonas sp.]OJV29991.1 MAG: hypothetical protein BGO24_14190 [Sphingomonas sp. 67-36]
MFEQLTIATITLLLIVSLHGAGLLSLDRLIQGIEHSVYFSTITYATIGHDDEGLMKTGASRQRWRG